MRTTHRALAFFAGILLLYLAVTGTVIQTIDLSTLLSGAGADDVNLQSMREGINGPPNFQVIVNSDYAAQPLPSALNLSTALATVLHAVRATAPSASLSFLEFRMLGGRAVVLAKSSSRTWRFDAATGASLAEEPSASSPAPSGPLISAHNTFKNLHRLTAYGRWLPALTIGIGLCLCIFLITGMWLYARLYAARARLRKDQVFWLAGGWWRSLHRAVALLSSVWILVVSITGTWLAIETVEIATYVLVHGERAGLRADVSSPLQDARLPVELERTLASHARAKGMPIKVVRLRNFAGMAQGVIISGTSPANTRQSVYNATTGQEAAESGPGYPPTGYATGWQFHEVIKKIHRGDYFGLTGRYFDLITGISIIFLSVSGGVMYFNLWNQRRRSGRKALYWTR